MTLTKIEKKNRKRLRALANSDKSVNWTHVGLMPILPRGPWHRFCIWVAKRPRL